MEVVNTLDIDGTQWEIQDVEARNQIAVLEESNTTNKTNIQNLQNEKLNIVAEKINVDLNTIDVDSFTYGTVKYYNVIKGSLNEPPFPTMSEPIAFYNMKVSKSYRTLIQEVESVYPNHAGNWAYIKFRRTQVDKTWFNWEKIESYVL